MQLIDQIRGFLEAERYDVKVAGNGRLDGRREAVAGVEQIFVWSADPSSAGFADTVRPMLRDMDKVDEDYPSANKVLVVETMAGLTADTRQALKKLNVKARTPIQFFDVEFRWESGTRAGTAAGALAKQGREIRASLVAQPYRNETTGETGDDLLYHLANRITEPHSRPTIHLVSGPAGIGKSQLFSALYAAVFEDFSTKKRQRFNKRTSSAVWDVAPATHKY